VVVLSVESADGTLVVLAEEGEGPTILIVHGGMSDESPWGPVAGELAKDFRVVRIRRRLYRLELSPDPATDFAREVDDLAAFTASLNAPCLIVGHSSGAIVALEALVAHPDAYAGAVLYEPPIVLDGPVGTPSSVARARAALAKNKVGTALRIFLKDCVRVPAATAYMAGIFSGFMPDLKKYVARQIEDMDAIDRLGRRVETYATIQTPVLFLTGGKSPAHLGERTRTLAGVMPHATITTMPEQGHGAQTADPALVARLISEQARAVGLGEPSSDDDHQADVPG
jgi:pimeloyl-ACP methyl ester carboxylesterase